MSRRGPSDAVLVLERIARYAAGADLLAWVGRGESLTFAQLETRSGAFAAWLLGRFGESRAPVLLYGGKEAGFLPCLLGALKSGRPYVPVDAISPWARVADIAADVGPCVIVDFTGHLGDIGAPILGREEVDAVLSAPPRRAVSQEHWVRGGDIAYILFTSGSTGRPKGVPITADNLAAFSHGVLPWLSGPPPFPYRGGNPNGVILDQVSYAFDVSGCALYAGLARGMTLLAVDAGMTAEPSLLFDALRSSALTIWVSTPSFAELCARSRAFDETLLPSLRILLFCGEVLTHKLCDALAARFPAARIVNTYGPTEATVLVSAVNVTREMRESPLPIPIGFPVEGTELRLDAPHEEDGERRGELLILGDSVGPGYLGQPEATAACFFNDEETGKRGYRTGDLCARRLGEYSVTAGELIRSLPEAIKVL
jgi:D-alanine--poly(phosphoribitol) ligase subunit 1